MVETLGEAYRLGWRVKAHCIQFGPKPKSIHDRSSVACDTVAELDMRTLLWTRGDRFPLSDLASRLKCPSCGSRRVQVIFEPPTGSPALSLLK